MIHDKHTYPSTDEEVAENRWLEIEEEEARYFLECVPPARNDREAFAVGECLNTTNDGRRVHRVVLHWNWRYWTKPYPLRAFDYNLFVEQVKAQLAADGVPYVQAIRNGL